MASDETTIQDDMDHEPGEKAADEKAVGDQEKVDFDNVFGFMCNLFHKDVVNRDWSSGETPKWYSRQGS